MQVVYISVRPHVLEETICCVARLMPFVSSMLVVVPSCMTNEFEFDTELKIAVVDEEEMLGSRYELFKQTTHRQAKSFLLRSAIAESESVEDVFILSDDDYRPLRPITREYFHDQGVDFGYYFHDLTRWRSNVTDFDKGLQWTGRYLLSVGQPTMAYSSHMPQIFRKELFRESLDLVREHTGCEAPPADEWSIYFNYVGSRFPDRFNVRRLYETLNWPPLPTDWAILEIPSRYSFENYYPEFYRQGRIFGGLSRLAGSEDWKINYKSKVDRRRAMETRCTQLAEGLIFSRTLAIYRAASAKFPGLIRKIRKPVNRIAEIIFRIS